jgi:hypothetical protein
MVSPSRIDRRVKSSRSFSSQGSEIEEADRITNPAQNRHGRTIRSTIGRQGKRRLKYTEEGAQNQFSDGPGPVFVGSDAVWHNQFHGRVENLTDFELYDEHTKLILRGAYKAVFKYLAPEISGI